MFLESPLANTIMMLKPISCYYMIFIWYKKSRDESLTCRCLLSNIMPETIFYDSMGWRMSQFFFLRGGNRCLPQHRTNGFSLTIIRPVGWGNYNGLRHMGSIIFQWGFNSGACLRIPELKFYWGVLLFDMFSCFKWGMLRFWSILPTWLDVATWC